MFMSARRDCRNLCIPKSHIPVVMLFRKLFFYLNECGAQPGLRGHYRKICLLRPNFSILMPNVKSIHYIPFNVHTYIPYIHIQIQVLVRYDSY